MLLEGKISKHILGDYENLVTVRVFDRDITFLYLSYCEAEEFDNESNEFEVGNNISVNVLLSLATIVDSTAIPKESFIQPERNCPSALFYGKVLDYEQESSELTIEVKGYGKLKVELEQDYLLKKGDLVQVRGEMSTDSR